MSGELQTDRELKITIETDKVFVFAYNFLKENFSQSNKVSALAWKINNEDTMS